MTQNASENLWAKVLVGIITLIIGCAIWAYVAGGIFLTINGKKFDEATITTLYQYWYYYGNSKKVSSQLIISICGAAIIVFGPVIGLIFAPKTRKLFGDAKFASRQHIKDSGLLGNQGIIVGMAKGHYLTLSNSLHAFLSAPTRGGKGVGIVIPNLLSWAGSVVVLDIKGENWNITSKYREKHGQKCFLFSPMAKDMKSHRYNPLSYISDNPYFRIDDVQKIANMFFPDDKKSNVIWTATPRSLFMGIVLYLLETPGKPVTIGQVLRETLHDEDVAKRFSQKIKFRELGEKIKQANSATARNKAEYHYREITNNNEVEPEKHPEIGDAAAWFKNHVDYKDAIQELDNDDQIISQILSQQNVDPEIGIGKSLSPSCKMGLNAFISISAETTRGGIIGGFRAALELWQNPLVDTATSDNDFDLRDIRKTPTSIYLYVQPGDLTSIGPLLNLFFQQLIDLNTRELPERNPDIKHECLLLMDEFTSIGAIPILSKGISFIAGYGLRMLPIIQSPSQLSEVYGKEAALNFQTNHALHIIFPPKPTETKVAQEISEALGYQTVKGKSKTTPRGFFGKGQGNGSHNESDQRRALLLPQEITNLGKKTV